MSIKTLQISKYNLIHRCFVTAEPNGPCQGGQIVCSQFLSMKNGLRHICLPANKAAKLPTAIPVTALDSLRTPRDFQWFFWSEKLVFLRRHADISIVFLWRPKPTIYNNGAISIHDRDQQNRYFRPNHVVSLSVF